MGANDAPAPKEAIDRFTEEIRHIVMVHHPRCRVRWVDDPLKKIIGEFTQINSRMETGAMPEKSTRFDKHAVLTWYELTLRADSRYPIGSGAAGERLATSTRSPNRAGAPGAGSDPLAAIIGMLGSDRERVVMGIQIVAAAHPDRVGEVQQSVSNELAQLRDIEMQAGKKALGPQHEVRVLALEEKADKQGYDVAIRFVALENAGTSGSQAYQSGEVGVVRGGKAEAWLESLLRIFKQYDRTIAGVNQGFEVVRIEQVSLNASESYAGSESLSSGSMLQRLAPVMGRYTREGVCLPRLLPFMKAGKPAVLNTVELSSVYHFPHQGLADLASLKWKNHRQITPPAMCHVTKEQLAKGGQVVLGVLDDDLAPESRDAHIGKDSQAYFPHTTDAAGIGTAKAPESTKPGANVLPPGTRGVARTSRI